MVFNMTQYLIWIIAGCAVWLVILTYVVFRMGIHYNSLTQGTTKATLRDILTALLAKQEHAEKSIQKLEEMEKQLERNGLDHYQRFGIVRFNPFSDTGGSQSFTVAILDGKDDGFVMTSLYARTGNRWYIKHIKGGKCEEMELSKEEQQAIKKSHSVN